MRGAAACKRGEDTQQSQHANMPLPSPVAGVLQRGAAVKICCCSKQDHNKPKDGKFNKESYFLNTRSIVAYQKPYPIRNTVLRVPNIVCYAGRFQDFWLNSGARQHEVFEIEFDFSEFDFGGCRLHRVQESLADFIKIAFAGPRRRQSRTRVKFRASLIRLYTKQSVK